MKKTFILCLTLLVSIIGIAFASVTYCVTVKCSKCNETYEMMDVTGKSQSDCENKAKKFVCNHPNNYKKAISAKGYCPKIDN